MYLLKAIKGRTLKSKLYKVKGKICNKGYKSKVIKDKDVKEEIKGCLRLLYY